MKHESGNPVYIIGTVFLFLLIHAGCDNDNGTDPDSRVETRKLVDCGRHPVWMPDGESFLFTYDEAVDTVGIFLADVPVTQITTVWDSAHNHDYQPSPDGEYIAFSTPGENSLIYLYEVSSGSIEPKINGRHPTWLANSWTIALENLRGGIIRLSIVTNDTEEILEEGSYPRGSPQNNLVAYLYPSIVSGFHLRIVDPDQPPSNPVNLVSYAGSDYVWDHAGSMLYVTQFTTESYGNIVKVDLLNPANPETVITGATHPSIGGNGAYLLAVTLDQDRSDGIVLYEFSAGKTLKLSDSGFYPAAHPDSQAALFEKEDGIYLLTW